MLRDLALALDGTVEAPFYDRLAFRVRRVYVRLSGDRKTATFYFTPEEQEMKCAVYPEAFRPLEGKWGRQGWTTTTLAKLSKDVLKAALQTAYVHGAAKLGRGRQLG
jgi:hypothetical protein